MPKPIDIDMLKKNPHVDLGKLEESQKLRDSIQQSGGIRGPKGAPTLSRRRARIIDDLANDARLVKLSVKYRFYGRNCGNNIVD
ncbi:MAG: hypothetical protein WBQ43_10805 [Terriglobales bacterium]